MAPAMAHVLRDGATAQVTAADIVNGDIVMVHAGDKVCTELLTTLYIHDTYAHTPSLLLIYRTAATAAAATLA